MARLTVGGNTLRLRVWGLLDDARAAAKLSPGAARVMQGSFNAGRVGASAGTHDGGGAFDLSVAGLSDAEQDRLIWHLRRRNVCAWIRSPEYGWGAQNGPEHIHGIVRDEPRLSATAAAQVAAYDRGRNGLANNGKDPHKRPKQYPVEEWRLMQWPLGKSRYIKPDESVVVEGGRWVTVATLDLPKGARFLVSFQIRSPKTLSKPGAVGEFRFGRVGWGTATGTDIDDTGQNPIPPRSDVQLWRTPGHHDIAGGGPLAYQVWLPGKTQKIRFVAKATRII